MSSSSPPRRPLWTVGRRRSTLPVLAALVGSLLAPGLATAESAPTELSTAGRFDEQVLFARNTDGYSCYRIPAIVRTTAGTVLAFAEGRVNDCGDDGNIDLVVKRSTDNGRTWSAPQVVLRGNGDTRGNPVPMVDSASGRIVLVTTFNPGDNDNERRPFVQYSEDDGRTWTAPREISDQIRKPEWNYWYATGPVHGIQLRRGPHAGRLVFGANYETAEPHTYGGLLAYSDDGGLTWQLGAVDARTDLSVTPQEISVVELTDGSIYAAARDNVGTDSGHRAFAVSRDGGESFEAPFRTLPELVAPIIQGATLRMHATDEGSRNNRILFSAPAHPASREVMTVRSSFDEGRSWQDWRQGKVVHWGPAAYSDMVALDDGLTGLLYEGGAQSAYESIRFARFDETYLNSPNAAPPGAGGPPAPGPSTPDRSGWDNDAYLRGGVELTDGRFGKAVDLDGRQDYVELPFDRSLDVGAGQFTWTAWVRHSLKAGSHAIMFGYRMGEGPTPGVWLRTEPENNRVRAFLGTEEGTVSVQTPGSYNDGAWHHYAIRRTSTDFELWIDGVKLAAAKAPAGSATVGKEFRIDGIDIGQRLDGQQRLDGAVDEVRMYRRALTDTELGQLVRSNAAISSGQVLRLPFERITG